MSKNLTIYLKDILHCCEKILNICNNISQDQFKLNEEKQAAVMYYLQIMGEATKKLHQADPTFTKKHSYIPWIDMAKMRDFLIHHYEQADASRVWLTVENDIPTLKTQITKIINSL